MSTKTVLITGGAGFIGSHIQDRFLGEGYDVAIVDNLISGKRENLDSRSEFFEVDICDENTLEEVFEKVRPTVVVHCAAQNQVPASMKDPRFDLEVNVRGMFNVLEASRKVGCKRFIYTNTGGALYGEQQEENLPLDEDVKVLAPLSFYNVSKLSGEYYLRLFSNLYDMTYISLRFANIYGPRQDALGEAGIIAIFTNKMIHGETPTINGDGKHTRDYVYVDDVVDAVMAGLAHQESDYFNISSGVEVSNTEVFEAIKEATGSSSEASYGPERAGDVRRNVLSNEKAKTILHWQPKTSLADGIKLTVDFVKSH